MRKSVLLERATRHGIERMSVDFDSDEVVPTSVQLAVLRKEGWEPKRIVIRYLDDDNYTGAEALGFRPRAAYLRA